MRFLLVTLVAGLPWLAVGPVAQAGESPIVGTWVGSIPDGPAFEWIFDEDGTWTIGVDGLAQSGSCTPDTDSVSLTTSYGQQYRGKLSKGLVIESGGVENPIAMVFKSPVPDRAGIRVALAAFVDLGSLGHVVLDRRERAYVIVQGLPLDIPEGQLAKVREEAAADEAVELIDWEDFKPKACSLLMKAIRHDEYGMKQLLGDFLHKIQNRATTPVGLTWNGGIAMTFSDYRHTEKTFQEYESDPEAYARRTEPDQQDDPVHPFNFLPWLLDSTGPPSE